MLLFLCGRAIQFRQMLLDVLDSGRREQMCDRLVRCHVLRMLLFLFWHKGNPMEDMNLVELVEKFADERRCRAYLEALRWPEGAICPRCDGKTVYRISKRNQFDCRSCRYQFSVMTGTIFKDTHLPLWKWFLATYLMIESKKAMSAHQLKRTLKISYQTAWYLCHRIRKAIEEASPEMLKGTVEVDESYIGGKRRHVGSGYVGNKTMVLGAIERGGHVHLRVESRK